MGMFVLKPSFAGGELTPALYGRPDLQKYDVGAAILENALVMRYGGVTRRPGFHVLANTAINKPARLIPFSYNTEQNYIIELSDKTLRVYKTGQYNSDTLIDPLISITTIYPSETLIKLKYTQSADTLLLVHPSYPPATLKRYSETDWRLSEIDWDYPPFDDPYYIPTWVDATTGKTTLHTTEDYFTAADVGRYVRLSHFIESQYKRGVPNSVGDNLMVFCMPNSSVYVETFGFWSGTIHVDKLNSTGTWERLKSQYANHSQNYNMTFENTDNEIRYYRVISDDFDPTLWDGENTNQGGDVSIQSFGKDYFGLVKIEQFVNAQTVTVEVIKQVGSTAQTEDASLSAWGGRDGYPSAVAFFEDRLVFAGSPAKPQTYWASKTGDYFNFETSIPQQDDDSVIGTLSSGQMNGIKAIVAFSEMLMLTSGGEYRVAGSNGQAFTPSNQQAKVQEYRGINDLMPVIIGGRIVYVQQHGSIVRDLEYSYDVDKFTGSDVSILAEHLFRNHTIVSLTYQQVPNSIVWMVRDDGVLLGLTYIKEQDVYAWHRHTTQGKFIDVCSVPGDVYDELWAVTERDGRYYIEQMAAIDTNTDAKSQFFVDCGFSYDYSDDPKDIIELPGYIGQTVSVLADGHYLGKFSVGMDAKVDLQHKYKIITVGLPYTTDIVTLPIEPQAQDGSLGSRKKRIERMMIHFQNSVGGEFGLYGHELDNIKWRVNEPYDSPVELFTGKKFFQIPQSSYDETLQIEIRTDEPFPMTVLSVIPEVLPGG